MSDLAIVDKGTGEVRGDYVGKKFKKKKLDMSKLQYAMFFGKNLSMMGKSNPSNKDIILGAILQEMGKDNYIHMVATFTNPLAKRMGINKSYIGQVVTDFVKRELLFSVTRGVYIVNPWIFGKDSFENIETMRWRFDAKFKKDSVELEHTIETTKAVK